MTDFGAVTCNLQYNPFPDCIWKLKCCDSGDCDGDHCGAAMWRGRHITSLTSQENCTACKEVCEASSRRHGFKLLDVALMRMRHRLIDIESYSKEHKDQTDPPKIGAMNR